MLSQTRPLSALGCSKKITSSIKQNLGGCGAGDLGQLNIIGFKIGELFYEQVVASSFMGSGAFSMSGMIHSFYCPSF